jgi:hypothetical protein
MFEEGTNMYAVSFPLFILYCIAIIKLMAAERSIALCHCNPSFFCKNSEALVRSQELLQGSASFHNRSNRMKRRVFPWFVQQFTRASVPLAPAFCRVGL